MKTKTKQRKGKSAKLAPGAARAQREAQQVAQDQARHAARRAAKRTPRRQRQAERAAQALARSAAAAVPKPKPPVALAVGTQPIAATDVAVPLVAAGEVVPKRKHPEQLPGKPLVIQRGHYAIFRGFHNHHCIRVDVGTKFVHYIQLDAAGLEVRQLSHDRFAQEYPEQCAYPLERAAQIFARLGNSAGYTAEAQRHLESIFNGQPKAPTQKEQAAMKKAKGKKASPFDPKRMIVKGNKAGLAKARAAKSGKLAKVNDEQRYVVALNNTRSGHMKTFMDAAEKFGKRGFRRADLVAATRKALTEERATTYFGYCVYRQLFKAA